MMSRYTLNGENFKLIDCEVLFEDVNRYMPSKGKHEWFFDGKLAFYTEGSPSDFSVYTHSGDTICRCLNDSLYDIDEVLMAKFFGIFKVGQIRKMGEEDSRRFSVRTKFYTHEATAKKLDELNQEFERLARGWDGHNQRD